MQSIELQEFRKEVAGRMEENIPRIQRCLNELDESEIWQRPNAASNSMGNLVLHLCGNIRQYIISSLGGNPDLRDRDAEFVAQGGHTRQELWEKLHETLQTALQIIRDTSDEEMMRTRSVQGFRQTGLAICLHVCEHLSYHTGQMVFWVKLLKDKDLAFYGGINLNVKNE